MMAKIQNIRGYEILDSRGNPTVKVLIELDNGMQAEASVPSGASTGAFEAYELRDGDMNRYHGKGVLQAVHNINTEIRDFLIGKEASEQESLDKGLRDLDGTENKKRLGANAILGASLAMCRVAAMEMGIPLYAYIHRKFFSERELSLPTPMFNILNGGQHADSGLCIQEFKCIPRGVLSYHEQLRAGSEIYHTLKKQLHAEGYVVGVGDEGGFAPHLKSNEKALTSILEAAEKSGYVAGKDIFLGIDAASNYFYHEDKGAYILEPESQTYTRQELIELYKQWVEKYHLLSIEDGLHEEDWEGWPMFHASMRDHDPKTMLIGDDFIVTNVKRLQKAIDMHACNSVLIKPNQIGTVSETIQTIQLAQQHAMKIVISHRSGETIDTFIADLAVGSGADFIKTGATTRSERTAKYNRLLEIETGLEVLSK